MSKLRLYGDTSGYIDVAAPATADNSTLDLSRVVKEDASGNVGIGTDSPTKPLHIYGNTSNNHQIRLQNDFGSGADWTLNAYGANGTLYIGNNLDRLMIDGSGRVTMPYQPAFAVHNISNPATSGYANNLPAKLIFSDVKTNNGNHYNNSTGIFTAPVDGYYYFSWSILVDDNASSGNVTNARIRRNDVNIGFAAYNQNSGGRYTQTSQSAVLSLNANDNITIHGDGFVHVGSESAFTGFLVG